MLELLFCSMLTILPDYLFRRYVQGKRFGKEINLYSVWFELRWGITSCLILTVCLITVIFYNHPSTTNVTMFFRTVPIVPEINGRVAEVYVGFSGPVAQGAPIFRLEQLETGGRRRGGTTEDCGARRSNGGGAGGRSKGRWPDQGRRGRSPADLG